MGKQDELRAPTSSSLDAGDVHPPSRAERRPCRPHHGVNVRCACVRNIDQVLPCRRIDRREGLHCSWGDPFVVAVV